MLPRLGTYRGMTGTRSRTCRRRESWLSGFLCGEHLRQSCPGRSKDVCCETSFLKISALDFLYIMQSTFPPFCGVMVVSKGRVGDGAREGVSPLVQSVWVSQARVTGICAASSHSHCHPSITELPLSSRFGPGWPDYAPRAAELSGSSSRAGQTGP